MDTAKAIAVEATHRRAWITVLPGDPTHGQDPAGHRGDDDLGTAPCTQVAVVTNRDEKNKSALYHPLLYPRASLVDPELMLTLPPKVTAATGFDVFAHAFESYIHPGGSPYTDMMALEALRLVARHLPIAVKNGKDLDAREGMAWADTLAGLCIANAGVTLPHGIGMAIGGLYPHVAHGEALAVVYPAILDYTYRGAPEKFAAVGQTDPRSRGEEPREGQRRHRAIHQRIGMGLRPATCACQTSSGPGRRSWSCRLQNHPRWQHGRREDISAGAIENAARAVSGRGRHQGPRPDGNGPQLAKETS
jgi:alcohol dehydrogenase class IV